MMLNGNRRKATKHPLGDIFLLCKKGYQLPLLLEGILIEKPSLNLVAENLFSGVNLGRKVSGDPKRSAGISEPSAAGAGRRAGAPIPLGRSTGWILGAS